MLTLFGIMVLLMGTFSQVSPSVQNSESYQIIPQAYAASTANVIIPPGAISSSCATANTCFIPNPVTIDVNGTVTWKNNGTGTVIHTVTSGLPGHPDGLFDSGNIPVGGTFSHTFNQTGSFNYHCSIHPWMAGVVTVQAVQSAHPTTLTLNSITSVPWSGAITIRGNLTDNTLSGAGVGGQIISFSGSGNVFSSVVTASNGTFTASGTAPSTVSTWQVQANFTGTTSYVKSTSAVQSYSTTKHNTSLVLTQPGNVPWSRPTSLTATLTDSSAGGSKVSARTINFIGTGVIGVANVSTNATGIAVGHGISPSTVAAGWTEQAHFESDTLYNSANSLVNTYSTTKHNTSLVLTQPGNVPWGGPISFSATLKDTDAGVPLPLRAISFTGTGVLAVPNANTTSSGVATGNGTAPSTVATGWKVQAHFVGGPSFKPSDSSVNMYNTTKHSSSITIKVTPNSVIHGNNFTVSGVALDSTTGLGISRTVTFTTDNPALVVPSTVTSSTGAYSISGLIAPDVPSGTIIHITVHLANGPLVNAAHTWASLTIN